MLEKVISGGPHVGENVAGDRDYRGIFIIDGKIRR